MPGQNETVAPQPANEILNRLLGSPPALGRPTLPEPTLADGLNAARQYAAIGQIADANHPIEALERKSIVAPFVLKIAGEDPLETAKTLRRVDIWFIAHGSLDKVTDQAFWKPA